MPPQPPLNAPQTQAMPQPQGQPSYTQLGQQIQAKYPQYQNQDPSQVGLLAAQKYPQYQHMSDGNIPQTQSQAPSVGGFLSNAIGSVGNFIGGAASAIGNIFNPDPTKNTLLNIGSAVAGVGEQAANATGLTHFDDHNTETAGNIEKFYNDRYGISDLLKGNVNGSLQKMAHTFYTDPAGAAADFSMLLEGGGSLLSKIGEASDASAATRAAEMGNVIPMGGTTADGARVTPQLALEGQTSTPQPSGFTRAGEVMRNAGEAVNPANIITKPISALGKSFEGMQNAMEEANLRLTPIQKTNLGAKVQGITSFISDNLPVGTPEGRFNAITNITDQMENTLQGTLRDNPEVSKITVPKSQVIAKLQALPEQFKDDPALYPLAKRQITEAIQAIQDTQEENIPLADLNKIKRSYSGNAFDQLGVKLKSEVKLAISGVPRQLIEDTLKDNNQEIDLPAKMQPLFGGREKVPVKEFNQVYGKAIQSKIFLKMAAGKSEAGLIARLIAGGMGGAIGGVTGGPIGGAVGAEAADFAAKNFSTPLRSAVGKAASKSGQIFVKAPALRTAALIANRASTLAPSNATPSPSIRVRRPQ